MWWFGSVQWELVVWGLSGGVASFFSPCALPMLPAYLSFYLSTESEGGLRRGVQFGSTAALGLLSVFALTAVVAGVAGSVLTRVISLLLPATGVVLIGLGGLLFVDRTDWLSRSVSLPAWREPSLAQFYFFGVLFAGGALGCTAPVFLAIMLSSLSTGGLVGTITVVGGYASGMIGLFVLMTVLIALAKDETVRRINRLIPYVERASAVLLIGAGGYMLYYYVQIQTL